MKRIIQLKLKWLAKIILFKYKPKIIGITGSVGKTSTKEAVYIVLASKFNVRQNIKNYNNELGLPLTIIGEESAGKNIFKWIWIFWKASKLILWKDKNYPQILVLEMGADRPKDLKYLTKIARPYIGVVTTVAPVHLEYFKDFSEIVEEKSRVIKAVKKDGWAILNTDDKNVAKMEKDTDAQTLTFGFSKKADIAADNVNFSFRNNKEHVNPSLTKVRAEAGNLQGISFKVSHEGSTVPVLLPNILGIGQVYSALVAIAVGVIYSMNLVEIANALRQFKPPKGRMNLVPGIKNAIIIDDTYNSAPESTKMALDVLHKIPLDKERERYAVLGDMLELGSISVQSHQDVGKYVVRQKIDVLICVGGRSRDIGEAAEKSGMSTNRIFYFSTSDDARKFVQERISKGDLVLVKGSQGMRMERIVKEIMAEPMKAGELLVRQDGEWE